jgi:signal transduction histidine kinase/ABC-type multidrug transport system ATPase subunit
VNAPGALAGSAVEVLRYRHESMVTAAPSRAPEPLLEVRGLTKRFGRHLVLDDVDLVVRPGELVALVGENGAGKSTLVQCVAGALSPDAGEVHLAGGRGDVGVVWQDLALCENLDAVANLFLGRELSGGPWLSDAEMHLEARRLLDDLGVTIDDLRRPASQLSGGQRQTLAIARALLGRSRLLVLDEPTAALGVAETHMVEGIVRDLRTNGCGVLLISHRIEQVFRLADRVVVLRHGRVAANRRTLELHPDDVVALMAGVDADTSARRQIQRLRSLVDQLAEEEPSASIPLIVSALSAALGVDQMCVHLLDRAGPDDAPVLTRRASVGVREPLLARNQVLPVGADGGLVGLAADRQAVVVTERVEDHPAWAGMRDAAIEAGVRSAWAMPIQDADGVLGVISAYADAVGTPQPAALELVSLYTNLAAAAIARERLLAEVTRRNRILEAMRGMLETLTGPQAAHGGMTPALGVLCEGLAADAVALLGATDGGELPVVRAATGFDGGAPSPVAAAEMVAAATVLLAGPAGLDRARLVGERVVGAPVVAPQGRLVLAAWWSTSTGIGNDTLDLLDDAARSLCLAVEREEVEFAQAEAATLRRTQRLQREFLSHLSHELRTPLTAIHGYASTLRQPDVTWDEDSERRFLGLIEGESARMGRLVADMLDSSAMEAGGLRLDPHWCDVGLAVEAAIGCVSGAEGAVTVDVRGDVPNVWVDHDRLEQVLVNLIDNAICHGRPGGAVQVSATAQAGAVTIRVLDDGPGFSPELAARVFQPYVRGETEAPGAGLGLAICRGLVEAHGGTIGLEPTPCGACVRVTIPIEPDPALEVAGEHVRR